MDVVQTAVVATANLLVPGSGVVVNGAIELAKILFQIGQVLNGMEENASLIKSQRSIMEKDVWRFRWLVEVLEQRVQNKELFTKELQKLIAKFETEIREYDRMAKTFLRQKVLKQLVFCKKFEATSTNVREIAENLEKCLQLECSISAAHTSAQDRNKQYMMLVDSPEVQSELSDPEVQKELLAIITVRGLRSEATQQTCDANVRVLSVIHDKLWARSSHTIREEVNNLPDWFMTEDDVDIDTSTVIGSGGDAKISKGVLRDGTSVAVKIFTESGKMSDAAKQKFISTIDLWKRMNDNDNICRLYGACYLTATPFIVMEYYDNGPLDQFLRQHEGDRCRHSLEILAQAAKAITKMHSMGIVHGDLKCDNILVSDSIQAKVSDFDRSFDWTAKKVKRLVNGKAADAGVEITDAVRHVAPECVKGMLPSSKSDVYSFGMTLYQALVGKAPYFDITSHEEVRECKLGGELPSRVAQLISDDAWALITQCCDPESDKRPTMEEVTVQLKSLLAQHVAGNPVHIVGCADDGSNHLAVSGIEMLVSQSVDAKGVEATSNRLHVFPSEAQSSTDGTPVKPSKSGSRSIPRLYKIIGAVVFVVVVGGIVGLIVGLGSSAGTHDSSSSTGSYWPSSSAGSDSNSGSSWSSSSASSSSASDVLGMGVSDLTILGPGSSPSLTHKGGMAVAANGVIYLSDGTRILRMTEGSKPTVYAGSADETGDADGARLEATFSSLGALAVSSSDDLFVCDGDKVRKITDNTVSTLYTAQSYPYFEGIALDSSENVYVTEFNNGIITRITSKGVSTFSNKLSTPEGIAIDALDNIYVTNNYQVVAFTSSGTMSVLAEYQSDESGLFRYPGSLAVGSDGDLYVADTKSYCIGKIGVTTKKVTCTLALAPKPGARMEPLAALHSSGFGQLQQPRITFFTSETACQRPTNTCARFTPQAYPRLPVAAPFLMLPLWVKMWRQSWTLILRLS